MTTPTRSNKGQGKGSGKQFFMDGDGKTSDACDDEDGLVCVERDAVGQYFFVPEQGNESEPDEAENGPDGVAGNKVLVNAD